MHIWKFITSKIQDSEFQVKQARLGRNSQKYEKKTFSDYKVLNEHDVLEMGNRFGTKKTHLLLNIFYGNLEKILQENNNFLQKMDSFRNFV